MGQSPSSIRICFCQLEYRDVILCEVSSVTLCTISSVVLVSFVIKIDKTRHLLLLFSSGQQRIARLTVFSVEILGLKLLSIKR